MFWIQPLFARMALPLLGGAPVVWNTAMVFFQTVLLAGYLYVHLSTRMLDLGRQALLHAAILAGALFLLPIGVSSDWLPPADGWPIPWLLSLFTIGVGLPFFALSATAPLLQKWFVHTGHRDSADPYFLYSASNIGSVAALLAYPVLVEPRMTLSGQSLAWTAGYGLFLVLIAACGTVIWRRIADKTPDRCADIVVATPDPINWRRRLHWIALAAVPSSLLLGVTTHLTTDAAAVPLFWVVPLALYLLTFVIVFARRPLIKHDWAVRLQPILLIPLVITPLWTHGPLLVVLLLHLSAFFLLALVCHGELARRRPQSAHLTEFYVWMSVGGMLGGAFTAILAPLIFDTVMEYPLAIVAAVALRPLLAPGGRRAAILDIALPAGVLVFLILFRTFALGPLLANSLTLEGQMVMFTLPLLLVALFVFSFSGRPVRLGLGFAALLMADLAVFKVDKFAPDPGSLMLADRSYFGVYRVLDYDTPRPRRLLTSGTTLHGTQALSEELVTLPTSYYHPEGPLGQVIYAWRSERELKRAGVVGLGAGATACYRRPGESWTFYEIDPTVVELARNTSLFTYLDRCGNPPVVLGDARLTLSRIPDPSFDLLVIDAFSSDAIPIHLLTAEAIDLFLSTLSEDGLLVFHVSSRYFDLKPILARQAEAAGVSALSQHFQPSPEVQATFGRPSEWVVFSRKASTLERLAADERWERTIVTGDTPLWTDDYADLFSALKFRWPKQETRLSKD